MTQFLLKIITFLVLAMMKKFSMERLRYPQSILKNGKQDKKNINLKVQFSEKKDFVPIFVSIDKNEKDVLKEFLNCIKIDSKIDFFCNVRANQKKQTHHDIVEETTSILSKFFIDQISRIEQKKIPIDNLLTNLKQISKSKQGLLEKKKIEEISIKTLTIIDEFNQCLISLKNHKEYQQLKAYSRHLDKEKDKFLQEDLDHLFKNLFKELKKMIEKKADKKALLYKQIKSTLVQTFLMRIKLKNNMISMDDKTKYWKYLKFIQKENWEEDCKDLQFIDKEQQEFWKYLNLRNKPSIEITRYDKGNYDKKILLEYKQTLLKGDPFNSIGRPLLSSEKNQIWDRFLVIINDPYCLIQQLYDINLKPLYQKYTEFVKEVEDYQLEENKEEINE